MNRASTGFPLLIAAMLLQACAGRAPEGSVVIHGSRLYTAPDQAPVDDGAVLLLDGRIVAAGPRDEVATRGAARLPQCNAGVLVAGFQNSHEHCGRASSKASCRGRAS